MAAQSSKLPKAADAWLEKTTWKGGLWEATNPNLLWSGLPVAWWAVDETPVVLRSSVLPSTTQKTLHRLAARAAELYGEVRRAGAYTAPPTPLTIAAVGNLLLSAPHTGDEGGAPE